MWTDTHGLTGNEPTNVAHGIVSTRRMGVIVTAMGQWSARVTVVCRYYSAAAQWCFSPILETGMDEPN